MENKNIMIVLESCILATQGYSEEKLIQECGFPRPLVLRGIRIAEILKQEPDLK